VLLVRNPDLCAINTFTTSFWGQFLKPKSNTAKADGCGFQHRCVEVDVNTLIQHSQIWEFPVAKQTTRPLQIANFDFVCQLKEIIKDCGYVDYCCVIGMRNGRQTLFIVYLFIFSLFHSLKTVCRENFHGFVVYYRKFSRGPTRREIEGVICELMMIFGNACGREKGTKIFHF